MLFALGHLSCVCALGRTNGEVLANLRQRSTAGMVPLSGEIPGRTVLFGEVRGALPEIDDPEYATRTNRILKLAADNQRAVFDDFVSRHGADRVAIVLGTSNTGIDEAQRHVDTWIDTGKRPAAMRFSEIELGAPSEYLARLLGVKGPAYSISTACSSSAKVFPAARRLIEAGVVDAAIVGGADGRCRFALNGFHALGALSEGLCRPLASDRDGINLGEGAALFTMERMDGNCGTVCFAGAGETSDAYHPTAPDPEGNGAEAAMRAALADADLPPEAVSYVNLHGTGTIANDGMELKALFRVFPGLLDENPQGPVYESTKPFTGHCLGAAGAIEAAVCWLKLASGEITGATLSNSFVFGGSNATIALATGHPRR